MNPNANLDKKVGAMREAILERLAEVGADTEEVKEKLETYIESIIFHYKINGVERMKGESKSMNEFIAETIVKAIRQ